MTDCDCYPYGWTPDTYEGPQEHCPVHGRSREEWMQIADEQRARADKAERELEDAKAAFEIDAELLREVTEQRDRAEREREDLDDRWTAQWQKTCHEVDTLKAENEALREELLDQWQANHFEHCSAEWPHPATREIPCHWPLPQVLDGEQEDSE